MRLTVPLAIPEPCPQSWAAMAPATAGRHCTACQKTVVDFTLKTDAEILTYLARAAGTRICGRFAAGQLVRPLQRAAPAAPTARWRAWLAAAVAVWAVREGASVAGKAQVPMEVRSVSDGNSEAINGPIPKAAGKETVLRGVVVDASNGETLPGVTVLLKGTQIGTSTSADGRFELRLPELKTDVGIIVISSVGYKTKECTVTGQEAEWVVKVEVSAHVLGELVYAKPWPWHPRSFYSWSKYWLTRPFRGY